jgi:hypothetical protein
MSVKAPILRIGGAEHADGERVQLPLRELAVQGAAPAVLAVDTDQERGERDSRKLPAPAAP